MSRDALARSLRIALAVSTILGLAVAGWLAWHRPEHGVAWLSRVPLCGA